VLHGYCVRRAGEPPPEEGLTGLESAPVRLIEEGMLGLWVSESPASKATAERLRTHDRVVRHALRSATPLPIRYGAGAFASESAAREALIERAAVLGQALDRVAGQVEMGVRVDWDSPPPSTRSAMPEGSGASGPPAGDPVVQGSTPGSGRAYLEARREALRERDALVRAAGEALDRVEREMGLDGVPSTRTLLPEPRTPGLMAHLVRRQDVQLYGRAVAAAREALPEYRITPSGPWAPYSFS
jgi:hypothetical protein